METVEWLSTGAALPRRSHRDAGASRASSAISRGFQAV